MRLNLASGEKDLNQHRLRPARSRLTDNWANNVGDMCHRTRGVKPALKKGDIMSTLKTSTRTLAALLVCAAAAPLALAGGGNYGMPSMPEILPPSSNPGECWARVAVPAQYSQSNQTVMVEEGYSTVEVMQPRLESRREAYVSKEASVRYEVKQPTYESISQQVMTRPAYDKLSVSPPQFSTVQERIQISQPQLVWKKGNPAELRSKGYTIHSTANGGQQGGGFYSEQSYNSGATHCGTTCEIWCLVEEPGEAVSFSRKVMTQPGQVRRQQVPAQFRTITKQVVSDPGGVREVHVPAEHATIVVEDVVDPGGERVVAHPAKYGDVSKRVMVTPETYEWRRVLCKPGTGGSSSYQGSAYQGSTHQGSSYQGTNYQGSSYQGSAHQSSGVTYGSGGSSYGSGHSTSSHQTSGHSTGMYESGSGHHSSSQPITYGNPGGQVTQPSNYAKKRKKWRHKH